MKIGIFGTFMSPICTPEVITNTAREVEASGIESLWMGEHVVLFDEMEFGYPASRDGKIPVPPGGGMLDPVATFGFVAQATETLRFGTGITLISQRHPLYTAKEFATLDWLSGGRIDFGVGVGWCKEEVISSGFSWEDRGARADEFLNVVQKLWTQELTTHDGNHFALPYPCRLDPKPVQTQLPVIVGGHSPAALRRAARYGSGWYGFAVDVETSRQLITNIDAALLAAGRTRDNFEIVITPASPPGRESQEEIDAFAAMGVDRLVLHMGSQRPEKLEPRLREVGRLAAAVA